MHAYEYRCKDCGERFEISGTIEQHAKEPKPACPKCHSHNVEQQPARFQAVTSNKTSS
jgi:putative FmdB family regulatory protein